MGGQKQAIDIDFSTVYRPLHHRTLEDPYPIYGRLLREAPIFWHNGLFAWVLSRHRDCQRVLQNPHVFTRDRGKLGRPADEGELSIQTVDPPLLIELRQAIMQSLRRINVVDASTNALDIMESCLDSQPKGQPFDFMARVAGPVAIRFACELVGLSEVSAETYKPIFLRLTRAMDREVYATNRHEGVKATMQLNGMIDVAMTSARPKSMIYELFRVGGTAEMLPSYVRNTVSAAFNAAFSTAYSSMGGFLLLCMENRGLAREIADGGQLALSTNELLRFTSSAQCTARFAICDTEISGVKIRKNDPIVTLMAAANRDPEVFDRADELVLNRSPNRHLSFGYGPHHCVGAKPAEEFLGAFILRLAQWEAKLNLAAKPSWLDTATLRCLDTLPLHCVQHRHSPVHNGQ